MRNYIGEFIEIFQLNYSTEELKFQLLIQIFFTDNDTLTITESSTILDGQLTITGDININNDITVSGNSNIGAIGKTISIKGALDVDEEVLIKSTLNVIDDTNVSS